MKVYFNKNWFLYFWIYELQNGIKFETIHTSNAENGDFKNSDNPSIHTAPSVRSLWLVRSVDVATESPSQGSVCKRLTQMIFLFLRLPGAITTRWKLNCGILMILKMEPREALSAVKNDMGLPFSLKQQQEDILINLCYNRHTFAQLPTGFGKSLIFAMFPLTKDKVG